MRKLVLLLAFFFCLQPVGATEFYITEAQLQTLETICQNYKKNNLTLQKQVDDLQQRVRILKTDSQTLETQLSQERETTMSLNRSLNEYETKNSQSETEKINLIQEIAELQIKIQKMRIRCITLSIITIGLILAAGAYTFIKIKY